MNYISIVVFCSILLCFSCREDEQPSSRPFLMGFTPFSSDVTLDAVQETYQNISKNGDLICHHFDNGVPWVEALNNMPLSKNILDDWNFRKNATPPTLKVYVSVAALNGERNGMAKYRGTEDNMELPDPWNSYKFSSPEVQTAYINYCKRTIDFFKPDFFNMNIEANLLYANNPSLWTDFLKFHQEVYLELKKLYPRLIIFSSVSGTHLIAGYFESNDVTSQKKAASQLLQHSDLFGISFYPFLSGVLGNPYPANSFEDLFNLNEKPIAIAEAGYPAQSFSINFGTNTKVTVNSDEGKQQKFLQDLLEACEREKAKFVINFVVKDYDKLWLAIGGKEDITIAWRDTGLIDELGKERSGFATWRSFYQRPYVP